MPSGDSQSAGPMQSITLHDLAKAALGTSELPSSDRVLRDIEDMGTRVVEMTTDEEAQKAATDFNGFQMGGRALTVNEARPKPEGGFGGGGGRGRERGSHRQCFRSPVDQRQRSDRPLGGSRHGPDGIA